MEKDISALRGQLLYRAKNLGIKELDLIIGSWATKYINTLTHEELLQFNDDVLMQETPDLQKKVLGYEKINPEETLLLKIREFALDTKYSKIEDC
jgi:succinate dehydrogenase flavin-adding protein (antitoxin of CptAB toxin-antitoxin module)